MRPHRPLRKKVVYLIAVASVLFAAYVLVPAAGYAGPPEKALETAEKRAAAKPRNDIPGLENFAQVSDVLYRGAQPEAAGFKELKRLGVKTIVNLRGFHTDEEMLQGLGFIYVQIRMNYLDPQDEQVAAFLTVVTRPELQPVFVHCQHGSDRTGTMVAAYRMAVQGWSVAEAMAELPVFGFHEVWQTLRTYLESFNVPKMAEAMKKVRMPNVKNVK